VLVTVTVVLERPYVPETVEVEPIVVLPLNVAAPVKVEVPVTAKFPPTVQLPATEVTVDHVGGAPEP
jgi:hypothetical protein